MKTLLASATLLEKIRRYYLEDDVRLSDREEEIRRRWSAAFTAMVSDHENDREVVSMLCRSFKISENQAYRDIANARFLFGDIRRSTKEALRYMVTEWAKELFRMAREKKDFRAMEKAIERITRANNLDTEDADIPDPSKIQPPVQLLAISFNFIGSPFFEKCDDRTKEALLKLDTQIRSLIEKSPVKDYLDMIVSAETLSTLKE